MTHPHPSPRAPAQNQTILPPHIVHYQLRQIAQQLALLSQQLSEATENLDQRIWTQVRGPVLHPPGAMPRHPIRPTSVGRVARNVQHHVQQHQQARAAAAAAITAAEAVRGDQLTNGIGHHDEVDEPMIDGPHSAQDGLRRDDSQSRVHRIDQRFPLEIHARAHRHPNGYGSQTLVDGNTTAVLTDITPEQLDLLTALRDMEQAAPRIGVQHGPVDGLAATASTQAMAQGTSGVIQRPTASAPLDGHGNHGTLHAEREPSRQIRSAEPIGQPRTQSLHREQQPEPVAQHPHGRTTFPGAITMTSREMRRAQAEALHQLMARIETNIRNRHMPTIEGVNEVITALSAMVHRQPLRRRPAFLAAPPGDHVDNHQPPRPSHQTGLHIQRADGRQSQHHNPESDVDVAAPNSANHPVYLLTPPTGALDDNINRQAHQRFAAQHLGHGPPAWPHPPFVHHGFGGLPMPFPMPHPMQQHPVFPGYMPLPPPGFNPAMMPGPFVGPQHVPQGLHHTANQPANHVQMQQPQPHVRPQQHVRQQQQQHHHHYHQQQQQQQQQQQVPQPAVVHVVQEENPIRELLRLLLPLGGHLWLFIRLLGFVFFFTGGSGWRRIATIFLGSAVVFIAQAGFLSGLREAAWGPVRRHLDGLLPLADVPAQRVRQADADAVVGEGRENTAADPAAMVARLVHEREHRPRGWFIGRVRDVERALVIFLASLVPGIGERHIAARDAAAAAATLAMLARAEAAPPAGAEVASPADAEVASPAGAEAAPPASPAGAEVVSPAGAEAAPPTSAEAAPPTSTEAAPSASAHQQPEAQGQVRAEVASHTGETTEQLLADNNEEATRPVSAATPQRTIMDGEPRTPPAQMDSPGHEETEAPPRRTRHTSVQNDDDDDDDNNDDDDDDFNGDQHA